MQLGTTEGAVFTHQDYALKQKEDWVEDPEEDHSAHIIEEVKRVKTKVFKVFIKRFCRLKIK